MKKGIIFDLDGTLWDSSKQVIPAWNRVLQKHGQHTITNAELASYMGKTQETIASLMMPDLPFEQAMEIFSECCREEQLDLEQHGGIVYADMERTLEQLQKEYSLYIVSNCHNEYMEAFFTAHGLRHFFEDWECHGNTGLSKEGNIRLIIYRNKLDTAVYVGDTELDGFSAKRAGIPFILAAYGFGTYPEADGVIDNITQLPEVLKNI